MKFKAQAALDFLMTYGWAILLVAIVAAAIVSLGILDTGSFIGSRTFGFSQVQPTAWRLEPSGALTIKLKNNAGTDINITSIMAQYENANVTYATPVSVANGAESPIITVGSLPSQQSGGSFSIKLAINYTDTESGFPYTDTGTISGKST